MDEISRTETANRITSLTTVNPPVFIVALGYDQSKAK